MIAGGTLIFVAFGIWFMTRCRHDWVYYTAHGAVARSFGRHRRVCVRCQADQRVR